MGRAGLEPALPQQELGPKPSAYANFATCPYGFRQDLLDRRLGLDIFLAQKGKIVNFMCSVSLRPTVQEVAIIGGRSFIRISPA